MNCFSINVLYQLWTSLGKGSGVGVGVIMSFSNDCGTLSFHRESLKGKVQDYAIHFHKEEVNIDLIITDTAKLFNELMKKFEDKIVSARLVAKVLFVHMGKEEEMEPRSYHFASYKSEIVFDPQDFFERHMMKISQRLDDFNNHGSNLVMKAISHIHIQLSCINRPT